MKICAYQICHSAETLRSVPAGFLVLDNLLNERPDWRELWPIRNFLVKNDLAENTLYGFLSPRFGEKTGLTFEAVSSFIESNYSNEDVVSFSPFWDLMSIFKNVFEQGDFFHGGLSETCQIFANQYAKSLDLSNSIMDSRNSIFCNYFFANKKFWSDWLVLANALFDAAEAPSTELSIRLQTATTYSTQQLPMKVFVQERLASICLLANTGLRSLNYSPFLLGSSITPFKNFFNEAVTSDALKKAYIQTHDPAYLVQFGEIREGILANLPGKLWVGDQ